VTKPRSSPTPAADGEAFDPLQARTDAWWTGLIAGQTGHTHPIHGPAVDARLKDGVLRLKGTVPDKADIQVLLEQAGRFKGQYITEIDNQLTVAEAADKPGRLVQSLVSTYESPDQARFAAEFVRSHLKDALAGLQVVERGRSVRDLLPEGFWREAEEAVDGRGTLLVITVDETAAFAARQLLEEETRSHSTIALPPQPAPDAMNS
jgi:hypothetical protein